MKFIGKLSILVMVLFFVTSLFPCQAEASSTIRDRQEIIVKYRDNSDISTDKTRNSFIQKYHLSKLDRKQFINVEDVKLELLEVAKSDDINDIAAKLSQEANVDFAVPNHKIKLFKKPFTQPQDELFSLQWGLNNTGQIIYEQTGKKGIDIEALQAWKITTGSPRVLVGILDTGIDINHEDLQGNIFINKDEIPGNGKDDDNNGYIDDVNGWDFAHQDNTVYDGFSNDAHATHVTGIIAAQDNTIGVRGVAPNVKILPLKFIDEDYGYVSDVIEAIEYGNKMGVKIFNCSWCMNDLDKALEFSMKKTNAVFVCAAGNYGEDVSVTPSYPACFNLPNIISVAAMDNQGELASFSNYGNKIDLAAPGLGIISTFPENQYQLSSGTSMATPFVTGTAALLASKGMNDPKEIVRQIKKNVSKTDKLKGKLKLGGYVDAFKSLKK